MLPVALARVILVPFNEFKDSRKLIVAAVLVASTETKLQPFIQMGIWISFLQELARW